MNESDRLALSDPDTYTDQDRVHALFAQLRREDPVAWCPEQYGKGYWAITKYDDIHYVSKNPQLFSSDGARGGITLEDPEDVARRVRAERGEEPATVGALAHSRAMITMDPPDHSVQRRLVAPGFTPQKLDAMTPRIGARVSQILDDIEGKTEIEFIESVAAELPIQVLAELFDVPQEDRHKLFHWSNILMGSRDEDIVMSSDYMEKGMTDMVMYALELSEARKQNPGDDLVSMLVRPNAQGEILSTEDLLGAFILLVVAGNETTRNSISGGLLALSQFPEQKQRLIDDPSLLPRAVNEIIRWVTPVVYMRRTALCDTNLGGKEIKQGDKLALCYMSGNRDEDKFTDPFRFDIGRDEVRHVSFGYGTHLCIGWRLAEIQLTEIIGQLLTRYPKIEVIGEVERMRTFFLNSIKRMQVRV
jgi:cytochrome P450